jgi:hypothetical protein
MAGVTMAQSFAPILLAAIVFLPGCLSPASPAPGGLSGIPAAGPAVTGGGGGTDLRYSLSVPEYVSMDWIENRQWTSIITVTNAGSGGADGYCINVSLVKNMTGEVVDSRYVQYSCGEGCIAPGTRYKNLVTFRPGWQVKGYYRATGGSCGGVWDPVSPADEKND